MAPQNFISSELYHKTDRKRTLWIARFANEAAAIRAKSATVSLFAHSLQLETFVP